MLFRQGVLFALVLLLMMPILVSAKDMQADQQCPPGGQVGQTCKDMTNGFVTNGHCTHINICKADSWNTSPPKGCGSSGNIHAPTGDCPKAPPISTGGPIRSATGTIPITVDSGSPINSTIFDQAFSDLGTSIDQSDNFVATTSLNGIEYFISGGEALPAGAQLTEAPEEIAPTPRVTLALGTAYGLTPTRPQAAPSGEGDAIKSYTPAIGTFTSNGSLGYSPPVDFAGQVVRLRGEIAGVFSQVIGHLFAPDNQSADRTPETRETPPLSLYAQVYWHPSTFTNNQTGSRSLGIIDQIFSYLKTISDFISAHVFPAFPRSEG